MWSFSVDEFAASLGIFYYILVYGIGLVTMRLSVIAFQFRRRVTIVLSNFFSGSRAGWRILSCRQI